MELILHRNWELVNAKTEQTMVIGAGTYVIERIRNPLDPCARNCWLVLAGTKVGMPESFWRRWEKRSLARRRQFHGFATPDEWQSFEVEIQE